MWEAEGRPSSFLAETGEITFEVTPRFGDFSEFVRNQLGLDSCSESGIPSLGIPPLNAATARVTYRIASMGSRWRYARETHLPSCMAITWVLPT
jgi:hypothetical protein